jgi:integrase
MTRRSTPPKYARHSSGQARVRIDGRVFYLGPYGSRESRESYARIVAQYLEENLASGVGCPLLSVGKLVLAYLEHCRKHYRKRGEETTEVNCIRLALRPLCRLYANEMARDFTPRKLKAVRQTMIDAGYVRTSINRHVGRIRRMFKWAVGEELVPAVVLVGLQSVKDLQHGRSDAVEAEPVRPVPQDRIDLIRRHVTRPIWGMIQLQLTTGMRPGEVLRIRGCDLNTSGRIWEYAPETHKTEHHGKQRIIFIGPRGQEVLREFLKPDLQAYLFSPADGREDFVRKQYRDGATVRALSRHYTIHSYSVAIRRACEIAFEMPGHLRNVRKFVASLTDLSDSTREVERKKLNREAAEWRRKHCWSPNQLRHNFATTARREFGIEATRTVLGHSSAVTTEIYAEKDMEAARAVIAKIG